MTNAALQWLKNRKVNVLEWQSQSPDLNSIQTLWHYLKTAVRKQHPLKLEGQNQYMLTPKVFFHVGKCMSEVQSMVLE